MNLEVPIELADGRSFSFTVASTIEMSRTTLDTGDYDGTVTYSFEVVASNSDNASRDLTLINSAGTTVATLTLPAFASSMKRYRTTFVPTSGASDYRIVLPATSSSSQIVVSTCRILVAQVGATKTKLYFPLLAASGENVNGTAYAQANSMFYSIWKKESAALLDLVSGTPWTLEAVLSESNGSRVATAGLFNIRTGVVVTGATVSTSSTTYALVQSSFADNATNFSDLDNYELRLKSSSNTSTAYLYKAGLWVKLTNLSRAQIHYRVFKTNSGTSDSIALPEVTSLSHPSSYFESTLNVATPTTSGETHFETASDDYGFTYTEDTNGYVNSVTSGKIRARSGTVTLTQGTRYLAVPGSYPNCSTGCGTVDGRIIINLVK